MLVIYFLRQENKILKEEENRNIVISKTLILHSKIRNLERYNKKLEDDLKRLLVELEKYYEH